MPFESLSGKVVLKCGAGSGRFTELLINNCELLVAQDFSGAVDANLKNCVGKRRYMLCQADINPSPLPDRFFDVVPCLSVIQHTPFFRGDNCQLGDTPKSQRTPRNRPLHEKLFSLCGDRLSYHGLTY